MKVKCFSCKKELEFDQGFNISRTEECPYCYANIHSCKMCKFFNTSSYNNCSEPSAERVVEKEKANFCDFYQLTNSTDSTNNINDAKAAAAALFK